MKPAPPGSTGNAGELRRLHVRPGLGASAHVVQPRGLDVARVVIDAPALIMVSRGCKTVHCSGGIKLQATPGQAIALGGNQTVDFFNEVTDGSRYEAHWLVFDPAVVTSFARAQMGIGAEVQHQASRLPAIPLCLHEAFERASRALAPDVDLPEPIIAHYLQEVLLWLALQGCAFAHASAPASTTARVRALLAGRLDRDWAVPDVARELAMSEPTLRRRLHAEGQRFGDILMDARMSFALTLLQASDQSIYNVANSVGYASASRFAVRFKQRFGFAPSSIRGHERGN